MHSSRSPLRQALAASVLLHGVLLVAAGLQVDLRAVTPPAPFNVSLRPAEASIPVESLHLPEAPRESARKSPVKKPASTAVLEKRSLRGGPTAATPMSATRFPVLSGEGERRARSQIARELLYPPEAIAQGLEGEALVLLVLDEAGNAMAARLEASSGHALLDAAAVRAARTLKGLPDGVPREVLLPVRFRLR